MALAKRDVEESSGTVDSCEAMVNLVASRLDYYLSSPLLDYKLAKVTVDDGVDLIEGGYYWVIRATDQDVWWVASDYFIYCNSRSYFNIGESAEALSLRASSFADQMATRADQ